ncbi:MAG: C25 family cysteine peptidase [Calditrichia bacterium]
MKNLFTSIFLIALMAAFAVAQQETIFLQNNRFNNISVVSSDDSGLEVELDLSEITAAAAETPWGSFTELRLNGMEGNLLETGKAKLPAVHKLLDIPYGAAVNVEVLSVQYEEVDLTAYGFEQPVLPYQGPIEKTKEALQNHIFKMDDAYYSADGFQRTSLAVIQDAGNLRGHRLMRLSINPVQYLPAANRIKVAKTARLKINFSGADYSSTREIHKKYQSPYFESVLKKMVLNYQPIRGDLTQYPVHYVLIYHDAFLNALQPLIEWKQQMGFEVTATPVSAIGNTTSAIQAYIQGLYNGPNPPTFVVFAGDKEQIPTFTGQTGSHVTDLYYVTITAGDYVPDIYMGRLSAQAEPQLVSQLNKILPHEKYEFAQTAFLNHGTFAATDDGGFYTVAENSHNYVIDNHFTPNNLQADKLYAITYNATGQDVINAVNNGRFLLNYSGHGSTTSWGGPSVSQSMVNATTNTGMHPFVISNACLTASFELSECFGETWARTQNGALAFTGASNSTYWDEDDIWEREAYDGIFWEDYHSLAAFNLRGNLAVLNGGYTRAKYYFEIYHLFGDPSTMLYWGEPSALTVTHNAVVFLGTNQFPVEVVGEDSALVSLYMNGTNYGTAMTAANGQATVQLDPIPSVPGDLILTVTKFNRQPYVDTLQLIPANGPYLFSLNPVFDDQAGNSNGIPEAGESLLMKFRVTNVGIEPAQLVNANLITADTMVQINNAQSNFGSIAPGDTVVTGEFPVSFSPSIPHLGNCQFTLQMQDSAANLWEQNVYVPVRRGARIVIMTDTLNFPDTYLNFTSEQELQLHNSGPDTLFVQRIESSAPQFFVQDSNLSIAPNRTKKVAVSFLPEIPQPYSAELTIVNSDPVQFAAQFTVNGSGIYAPDIAVSPDSFYQQLALDDSLLLPVVIHNEGLGELVFNAQIAGSKSGQLRGSGGADNFGHIWIDSEEPGGPEFNWIDISQTGSEVQLTGNNSISNPLNLGFVMPFYGNSYNQVRACTNGWLSFTTFSVAYNNFILPSNLAPRAMIAPLWDDLNFQQESNKAIFLYQDVYTVSGEGPYTFEAILYENGNIMLQYLHLTNLLHNYTVGMQNQEADDGLTVAHNENYLQDSLSILISKHSWATVSPMAGVLAPQSSDTLQLALKTHGLPLGDFKAIIQIESNDPDETIWYVPVHIRVDSVAVGIAENGALKPTRFKLEQNWPNPFNPVTTISYALPKAADVKLTIYNTLGQKVKTLVNSRQPSDFYQVQWDGTNQTGLPVASGIYVYRLQAGSKVAVKKLMLMK